MALFALAKPQITTRLARSGASDRTSNVLSAYKELFVHAKELPCRATSGPDPKPTSVAPATRSQSHGNHRHKGQGPVRALSLQSMIYYVGT
jgi:hypothetical protein